MNIIIVGDGKVGSSLATHLSQEGHNVTIVDSNPTVLNESAEQLDVMAVIGNGANMETLRTAGAEHADVLIAATSRDELNLLTCLTAKMLGTHHTIARIRNPEYTDQLVVMRDQLGLSMTVNPDLAAATEVYQLLQFPSFLKRDSFAKGRVEIVALKVEEQSKLAGRPLFKLYETAGVNVLVCAVERDGEVHIPKGSFTLQAGDTLYVTADLQNLALLVKSLGLVEKRIRSVFIIGGSRVAFYLGKRCLESGIAVKIVEQDHNRCVELAETLPKATIIEADGSREDILMAEGLKGYDACVTLTGMDEENLVLSMYANHLGVSKVITKINRLEYTDFFKNVGIGSVVSPKGLCTSIIVRYVRAMSSASGADSVLTLHPIAEGKAEATEFRVEPSTKFQNTPLKEVPLKQGVLIAGITRKGRTIIPKGDSSFQAGDAVIVVTSGQAVTSLDQIFQG